MATLNSVYINILRPQGNTSSPKIKPTFVLDIGRYATLLVVWLGGSAGKREWRRGGSSELGKFMFLHGGHIGLNLIYISTYFVEKKIIYLS